MLDQSLDLAGAPIGEQPLVHYKGSTIGFRTLLDGRQSPDLPCLNGLFVDTVAFVSDITCTSFFRIVSDIQATLRVWPALAATSLPHQTIASANCEYLTGRPLYAQVPVHFWQTVCAKACPV